MKEPWEWDEDDILVLIRDNIKESLTIEYKECRALQKFDKNKSDVSKDVSSFANSAGGTIIYGVKEKDDNPYEIDSGYDPTEISKEWLENVIVSTIHRKIDGIRINPVQLSGESLGRVIYVVFIPQSMRAPHMANDKRYYKRYETQSVPMEDYEVKDVSRRYETPDLELLTNFSHPQETAIDYNGKMNEGFIIDTSINIRNNAQKPAEYLVIRLFIDFRIKCRGYDTSFSYFDKLTEVSSTIGTLSVYQYYKYWSIPKHMPIWQGVDFNIFDTPLKLFIPKMPPVDYTFGWKIDSPNMKTKCYFSKFTSRGNTVIVDQTSNIYLD